MQETLFQSLNPEDPLEKTMASSSSILAWRIPWTEELGRLQSMGSQRVDHDYSIFQLHDFRSGSFTSHRKIPNIFCLENNY